MKCPIDNADLVMTERSGIEIDYCPKCRGVWLDRGELDKIIERSMGDAAGARPVSEPRSDDRRRDDRGRYEDDHGSDDHGRGKRRRGGLLGEIFDF